MTHKGGDGDILKGHLMKEDKQATGPTLHRWQMGEGTRNEFCAPAKAKAKKLAEAKGPHDRTAPATKRTDKKPQGAFVASGLSFRLQGRSRPIKLLILIQTL